MHKCHRTIRWGLNNSWMRAGCGQTLSCGDINRRDTDYNVTATKDEQILVITPDWKAIISMRATAL